MKKIAVIGSGISGLGAAWALRNTAEVTLFEADSRLGGHACTHQFDYEGHPTAVDLGFIVYNDLNYPNLVGLFDALGVRTEASDMSFSVSDPQGWEWASTAQGFFAQKRNLFSPRFHGFWQTILRFNDLARQEYADGCIRETTLGAWLDRHGFDETFQRNYILPMGAAIWSTPEDRMLEYPARSFFQFFDNHRLMHRERPKWRTVTGGSCAYVDRIAADLGSRARTNTPVRRLFSFGPKVAVELADGSRQMFDDVILATHADIAYKLTKDAFPDQAFLLRSVPFRPNRIYLHRDPALMPRRRAAWASWNVLKQESGELCLSYWMNRLQNLDYNRPLFITLNPDTPPRPEQTFLEYEFDHPQFDAASEAATRSLKRIQGQNGLWISGAWMGRGFHEDGLKSGLSAALSLGGRVPWKPENVDILQGSRKTAPIAVAAEVSL